MKPSALGWFHHQPKGNGSKMLPLSFLGKEVKVGGFNQPNLKNMLVKLDDFPKWG